MTRATIVGTPLDLDAGEAGPAELRAAFARAHEPYVEPGAAARAGEGRRGRGLRGRPVARRPALGRRSAARADQRSLDERLAEGLAELIARLARGGVSELPAAPAAHRSLARALRAEGLGPGSIVPSTVSRRWRGACSAC